MSNSNKMNRKSQTMTRTKFLPKGWKTPKSRGMSKRRFLNRKSGSEPPV